MPRIARNYYDVFDAIYRECWGTALHHGWYEHEASRARPAVALARFQREIIERLTLKSGLTLCDVGCGYGDFPASLVRSGGVASAVGLTNSHAQVDYSRRVRGSIDGLEIFAGDWLENSFPAQSFDRLVAIESLYHFTGAGKQMAIREMARVLRPDGRAVVTVWLRRDASWWSRSVDRGMGAWQDGFGSLMCEAECRTWFDRNGLQIDEYRDVSVYVRPTLGILFQRLAAMLWAEPSVCKLIVRDPSSCVRAGIAFAATWLGYATGALRYGVLMLRKP